MKYSWILLLTILLTIVCNVHATESRRQTWLTPSVESLDDVSPLEPPSESVLPVEPLEDIRSPMSQATRRITLDRIVLLNNTVLSEEAVATITSQFVHRPLSDADLHELRNELSKLYLAAGYLNSGVVLPDQEIKDATLQLHAIEGTVSSIDVSGTKRLRQGYLAKRLNSHVTSPLNVNQLRDAIQLLQRNPNVARVDAYIEPGTNQGDGSLRIEVKESPPASWFINADNHRSEAIGAERLSVGFLHTNLTGNSDQLVAEISTSEGAETGSVSYTFPVSSNDTSLRAYYARDQVNVVEQPFRSLDITTETDTYGISLTVPLQESLTRTFRLTIGAEVKDSQTELGGVPFSLSSGSLDGESRVSVLSAGADWIQRSPNQVIALRGTLRRGLDVLNATDAQPTAFDPSDIDAKFLSFLGQLQYVRHIADGLEGTIRSTLQLADDQLLGIEKLAVGGVNTVRGYRENLLVRDNGWATSFELSWRPFHEAEAAWQRSFALVPFVDYGRSWDKKDNDTTSVSRDTSDPVYIASAGMGFRCNPLPGLSAALYWAHDIADGFSSGDDPRKGQRQNGLQDDGIHFSLSYRRNF